MTAPAAPVSLLDLPRCFDGLIPAVLCTASAAGVPNITYLSKVALLDAEHVALSNQFLSKSARNLAEVPYASVLVVDSETHDEYRLTLAYERTERRGPVFERLRADVDAIAAMSGMQGVFRLQAADVYRVADVEPMRVWPTGPEPEGEPTWSVPPPRDRSAAAAGLGELSARISRCGDLDTLVRLVVDGLAELLGHEHSMLLLADEDGRRLFTIASRGYDAQGVGSEQPVGEGLAGMAAARCTPIRVGYLRQATRYGAKVRRSFEEAGGIRPGREIPLPGLDGAQSRLAVPAMALGQLVGVLMVETVRFDDYDDAASLGVVASLVAAAIESIRAEERVAEARAGASGRPTAPAPAPQDTTHVRFFPVDGSAFLDGDYLIKGVAGRLLWSLLRQYEGEGRVDFTNREVRLDPSLDLPDFRDNFESRLILLKRRLDERGAPVRIEKTGRGRFRLEVATALRLEEMGAPDQ